MNKFTRIAVLCFVLCLVFAPAMIIAADGVNESATVASSVVAADTAKSAFGLASAAIGAGLVIIGGGYGISRIGASAVESMARQPELAGSIQTAMIIAAALIEGVTFFALIICILCIFM